MLAGAMGNLIITGAKRMALCDMRGVTAGGLETCGPRSPRLLSKCYRLRAHT